MLTMYLAACSAMSFLDSSTTVQRCRIMSPIDMSSESRCCENHVSVASFRIISLACTHPRPSGRGVSPSTTRHRGCCGSVTPSKDPLPTKQKWRQLAADRTRVDALINFHYHYQITNPRLLVKHFTVTRKVTVLHKTLNAAVDYEFVPWYINIKYCLQRIPAMKKIRVI